MLKMTQFQRNIEGLFSHLFPLISIIAICVGIFVVGYWFLYKKLCKGEKTLKLPSFLWWTGLLVYTGAVLYVTVCSRPPSYVWQWNLIPLLSVFEWILGESEQFFLIIYNILMWIPFGMLIQYRYISSIRKKALLLCVFPLCLELIQFLTHRGICDIDDYLMALLGEGIGLGAMQIFYCIKRRCSLKKKLAKRVDGKFSLILCVFNIAKCR